MTYKIDPDALHKVAKQIVGLPLDGGELITHAIQLLADEYPELIDPAPRRWVGSKAGGILGKVRFLYFSPREYLVIFGTPTGTQGFSGRYKHVQIHKFLMVGQIDWYDLESDDTAAMTLLPGEHACMEKGPREQTQNCPKSAENGQVCVCWRWLRRGERRLQPSGFGADG
jgi:sigma non-opioid intracellular receptor